MCHFILSIAGPIFGAFTATLLGLVVAWWHWRRDGRDEFRAITAEQRAKLEEWTDSPEVFIEQSIPVLRPAIYRVRRFARDWDGLYLLWCEYKAKDHKNTETTAGVCLVQDVLAKHGQGKTAVQSLADYLDKFDDHVA